MHELLLLLAALIAQDTVDQIPEAMRRLVCRLAAKLPGEYADTMREEWLAELEAIPGKLLKLGFLLPLLLGQAEIRRAIAESSAHAREEDQAEINIDENSLERIAVLKAQLYEEQLRLQMHGKFMGMRYTAREEAQAYVDQFANSSDPVELAICESSRQNVQSETASIEGFKQRERISIAEILTIQQMLFNLDESYIQREPHDFGPSEPD